MGRTKLDREGRLGCLYRATNLVDGGVYVGITLAGLAERKRKHLKCVKDGVPYRFYRAIRKHGEENFIWTIVADGFSWETLCAMERDEIARLKSSGAKIYNMTSGGDGAPGWQCTPEISAKMAASAKRRASDPAERERLRAIATGVEPSAETRAKLSAAGKGRKLSPEHAAKVKAANIKRHAEIVWTPEMRASMAERAKLNKLSDEARAKISAKMKGVPKSAETIAKFSARMKGVPRTQEEKDKISMGLKGKRASEEAREKLRQSMLRRWAERRAS